MTAAECCVLMGLSPDELAEVLRERIFPAPDFVLHKSPHWHEATVVGFKKRIEQRVALDRAERIIDGIP